MLDLIWDLMEKLLLRCAILSSREKRVENESKIAVSDKQID